MSMKPLNRFSEKQLRTVHAAVSTAEELVSNYYKLSMSQWLRSRFDVRTLAELAAGEVVHGPFAQLVRYVGRKRDESLVSGAYDFYKICIQDHSVISTLERSRDLGLFPFILYVVTHELIHIVRFSRFLQAFDAPLKERMDEEGRVHRRTFEILEKQRIDGLEAALGYYRPWRVGGEHASGRGHGKKIIHLP